MLTVIKFWTKDTPICKRSSSMVALPEREGAQHGRASWALRAAGARFRASADLSQSALVEDQLDKYHVKQFDRLSRAFLTAASKWFCYHVPGF